MKIDGNWICVAVESIVAVHEEMGCHFEFHVDENITIYTESLGNLDAKEISRRLIKRLPDRFDVSLFLESEMILVEYND